MSLFGSIRIQWYLLRGRNSKSNDEHTSSKCYLWHLRKWACLSSKCTDLLELNAVKIIMFILDVPCGVFKPISNTVEWLDMHECECTHMWDDTLSRQWLHIATYVSTGSNDAPKIKQSNKTGKEYLELVIKDENHDFSSVVFITQEVSKLTEMTLRYFSGSHDELVYSSKC